MGIVRCGKSREGTCDILLTGPTDSGMRRGVWNHGMVCFQQNPKVRNGENNCHAAQIPQQPAVTTSSACLNGCFQDGSLVFVASDLRNFEKISINIEQFCKLVFRP
ncbi:unnamed protein product [Toxocara canis]|uniref:Uncharacterized protein n=1 Tax=Toxocara canis TaxID=6265 RepID=A0A183UZ93_TOXCA|nr:unnamed protein product [Toxocara canis]